MQPQRTLPPHRIGVLAEMFLFFSNREYNGRYGCNGLNSVRRFAGVARRLRKGKPMGCCAKVRIVPFSLEKSSVGFAAREIDRIECLRS